MKYKIEIRSIFEIGQRTNQEDCIYPTKEDANARLFILCDGMGGHEHGEVASSAVCDAMSKYVNEHYAFDRPFTEADFNEALAFAYDALDEKDKDDDKKKMGTTLTFLLLHPNGAFIAHIGDSRVYHIRPSEKKILFQTRDHSLVNDLISIGELTPEEAKHSNQKNIITRAMQPHQSQRPKADVKQITDIRSGDWFMLCSDGMLEELENQNIVNILSNRKTSIDEKTEIMKQVSKDSKDNHSAHIIFVKRVDSEKKCWLRRLLGK